MMKKAITTALCFLVLSGCGLLHRSETVAVALNYDKLDHDTFAVLPFMDTRGRGKDRFRFNASEVMTDAFETAFLENGYKVVERSRIKRVTDELKYSYSGEVDPEQLREIGKLTNSQVIVLGLIRTFRPAEFLDKKKPGKPTRCTTISFSVKAIHIETGEILWKGAITKSTGFKGDFLYSCDYSLLKYADKISRDMVKKIKAEIDKNSTAEVP